MNQTAQEPQIIIKGREVDELNKLLDKMNHEDAKKIIAFVNTCQTKRQLEQKETLEKEAFANEKAAFLKEKEAWLQQQKPAKLNVDEGDE